MINSRKWRRFLSMTNFDDHDASPFDTRRMWNFRWTMIDDDRKISRLKSRIMEFSSGDDRWMISYVSYSMGLDVVFVFGRRIYRSILISRNHLRSIANEIVHRFELSHVNSSPSFSQPYLQFTGISPRHPKRATKTRPIAKHVLRKLFCLRSRRIADNLR